MKFLDANIFVRALTGDDPAKAAACERLFRRLAAGADEATTSESVLAEVVYVLASSRHYGFDRREISDSFAPYFAIRNLRIPDRDVHIRALALYGSTPRLDFEDALTAARFEADGIDLLVSYDTGFDEIAGITRVEPE